jgi:glyoxalase family protein
MLYGIHHITAIASNPKQTVGFYSGLLGLRLVKKSVNQDQVEAYHLFFGDRTGEPGMDLTFFVFSGIGQGINGVGEVSEVRLAVRQQSLLFWEKRLKQAKIEYEVFVSGISFKDPNGLRLMLVGVSEEVYRAGVGEVWETESIKRSDAIGFFESAVLTVEKNGLIVPLLTEVMGYVRKDTEDDLVRYELSSSTRAGYVWVEEKTHVLESRQGAGSVHHIAFAVKDEADLKLHQQHLAEFDLRPTPVIDRYYFKSVYFRTPAGILFELATMGPGFTVDEAEDDLGQRLALPPFLEADREVIEAGLEPI